MDQFQITLAVFLFFLLPEKAEDTYRASSPHHTARCVAATPELPPGWPTQVAPSLLCKFLAGFRALRCLHLLPPLFLCKRKAWEPNSSPDYHQQHNLLSLTISALYMVNRKYWKPSSHNDINNLSEGKYIFSQVLRHGFIIVQPLWSLDWIQFSLWRRFSFQVCVSVGML